MAFKSYRGESRKNFGTSNTESLSLEQINTGAILRIADATEAMAKTHIQLQNDYNYMKDSRDRYRDAVTRLENSIRTLKGNNTKLKKQIQQLKEPNSSNV